MEYKRRNGLQREIYNSSKYMTSQKKSFIFSELWMELYDPFKSANLV